MKNKLILKASAGTGKTYRLSLEYIGALVRGVDFREILVMTFTRKATSEIKERIISFLHGICSDSEMYHEIEGNLQGIYGEDFKIDRDEIENIYLEVSQNRDKLKIFTIDAFTNMIFRNAIAPYLKLYKYEIIDDKENHEILVKTFQRLFENRDSFEVFKEFLEDNSEKDMENYVELIKSILNERWKFIVIGEELLNREKYLEFQDIEKNVYDFWGIICELAELKGKEPKEILRTAFQEFGEEDEKEEYILEHYELFLKDNPWHGNKIRSTKALDLEKIKADMGNIYSEMKSNVAKKLFNDKVVPYEKKLLKTIRTVYEIYDEIKLKEKKFTYSDISNYTFRYLRDKELGFVGEDGYLTDDFFDIIDGKVTSIFIDEFQDTSILQWKILKNIIDRSRDIICVGDEKQSIYGWRGGEKRLFENLEKILDGDVEVLNTCYRSRENIIKYVNRAFQGVSLFVDSKSDGRRKWNYTDVSYLPKDEKGYVEVAVGDEENPSMDILVEKITQNFSGNYKGIGIIARKRETLKLIGERLAQLEIPYTLESETNIYDTESARPLFSLITWMVKGDYLALLDFLRSDAVRISAETLKKLITERDEVEKWLGDMDNKDENSICRALDTVKKLYGIYLRDRGQTSCLAYEMIRELGVLDIYNTKEDRKDIFAFYKVIKEYGYFSEFLFDVEENSDSGKFKKESGKGEGISLLTIHKSKGLEFDTVFYFIPKPKTPRGYIGIRSFFKIDEKYNEAVDFLITHSKFNCILENIGELGYLEEEKEKEELEELNNLYVALTRPKKNLFVIIEDDKTVEKANLIPLLIPEPMGELLVGEDEEKENMAPEGMVKLNLCGGERGYRVPLEENHQEGLEKIKNHDLILEDKRVKGNIIHFFLENLTSWNEKSVEMAKLITFSRFASAVGKKELCEIFSRDNLEKIKKQCENLFNEDWDYVYREHTLYYKNVETDETEILRLDRVMIKKPCDGKKGVVFIADYKTGSYGEEQIAKYEKAVKQYMANHRIKTGDYEFISKYIEITL